VSLVSVVTCSAQAPGSPGNSAGRVDDEDVIDGIRVLSSVDDVVREVARCGATDGEPHVLASGAGEKGGREAYRGTRANRQKDCAGVIYAWSSLMPLSRLGVANIAAATDEVGIELALVDGEQLREWFNVLDENSSIEGAALISKMIAAGVTVHYPATLVYNTSGLDGSAILGFKTQEAYRELLVHRLRRGTVRVAPINRGLGSEKNELPRMDPTMSAKAAHGSVRDIELEGRPGPYFHPRSIGWCEPCRSRVDRSHSQPRRPLLLYSKAAPGRS
jgi:hypothetical protein